MARDYFPKVEPRPVAASPVSQSGAAETHREDAARRLELKGLGVLDQAGAVALSEDVRRAAGQVVFVDARDEARYQEGHIPGAWQFDYYHPEATLGTVLPVCHAAEEIVVYCEGADCEDAELAALFLAEAGIPRERLRVYAGGFSEWVANRRPVERGVRDSGEVTQ